MNFNVYIEDSLGHKIECIADESGKKRNHIIREALAEWVERHDNSQWPESIKNFTGIQNFPPFESSRSELSPPKEDIFE